MPTASEDWLYGGKRGASRKAFDAMVKTYGREKAEQVYAATSAKKRAQRGKGSLVDRVRAAGKGRR